jgi:hypothetical protein
MQHDSTKLNRIANHNYNYYQRQDITGLHIEHVQKKQWK